MDEFKHIKAVGFEVEGMWTKERVFTEEDGIYNIGFRSDGSVSGLVGNSELQWQGEFATRPITKAEQVENELEIAWPERWNNTCGFHIHISTKSMESYSRLMDKPFYNIFKREIEQSLIGSLKDEETRKIFQRRIDGESTYCHTGWRAEQQAIATDKGSIRYHHLNFCWNLHGTMEVRVPPMMTLEDGKTTTNYITTLVETYLQKRKKIVSFKTEIETDSMTILPTNTKFETTIKNEI